ncbi:hypothetical protein TSAR_007278 [Trichomalopsis sarcophagae]|uniref:Flavin-containing monooxygenase n=1 Tax=Trichomalopsis sarcophagae TaxID=543379 RepID=A0A232ERE9_9HYME|nr:hypothetical protein TSAR_007278 [Trichomalopsis sarcophagae]
MSQHTKKRVCVIGAGASGLCAAKFLSLDPDFFQFTVFERNNAIGGTWVYTDDTGNDEYGLPIHTSMYKNLRTNVPRELMNFPDYEKLGGDDGIHCCVTREDMLKYLNDYANFFDLRKFIQFNTIVERITPETADGDSATTWNVSVKNLKNNEVSKLKFDAVMVCNGHYAVPYIPAIPGIETFPGKVLHSHSYRRPEEFSGQRVAVLGGYVSGIDISSEISPYASEVYLSHNKNELKCELPSNVKQVSGVQKIEGNKLVLNDGATIVADSFIYCTGYLYTYPFLDDSCNIVVDDNHVTPLYKHLINIHHPTMCFIGLANTVLPFLFFHVQVQYFLSSLKGVVKLPPRDVMLEQLKSEVIPKKKDYHKFDCKQWAYYKELSREGQFEPPANYYKNGFEAWKILRGQFPVNSKYFKFVLLKDGESVKYLKQDGSDFLDSEMKKCVFQC